MAGTTRAKRQPPKEAPRPPRPHAHKKLHDAGLSPGSSKLAALQRALGNRAVARLVQREAASPAQRDALLPLARQQMEQGARMALASAGMAGQLASGPVNIPGALAAGVEPSAAAARAILANLTAAGNLIDSGVDIFQQVGGELADVEHMLRLRARVSDAIFWLTQMVAGNAGAGPPAAQALMGVPAEWALYQAGEAPNVVKAATTAPGPPAEAEALQAQARSAALKPLLAPLGAAPISP
ncbi:MAG: hypothetical protein C0506_02830 [Anaerolinea sp.]|nr:hypothetical protein [Anaerolinea sp.]